ncbi:3-oxo-5-alpha-steroid 4-dehydrogenase 1 [Octopus sinensis]|uniref:3-oxo-5alpha-steroid 4-dehydrogenase (NADP(+)) n=1 Tax=Octopus sinensis TaxID=2607531 RepID=A0A6P7SXD9_9MOLL|nr:3-oxo-5-alpha-steroid 4-dehydrogenase 1 [Octopus sinensis]XP_029642999.1 3-oxo-5-alpha-steroid 4-dehydrogenase 1 [Octopus sinensis]XP_029643000.1 3-oxo-5-alpha-steroid 4-dehydrogenase 1 [Octopus sinensis]XP_036363248.1 3-oxo-5-alpha-steroid 4-dehydrogenase 1 [Octopus sinensis]XP_036363249.1 3-oxo-5-alpha-steroid 4-dehydrogenase 1 [Octopus sinensis]XP_036363251.1 3-oxo-5-alpha-steroid 4-dehydrogenase 1 [Octopus sinensis]
MLETLLGDDRELLKRISIFFHIWAVITFVVLFLIPAPYGRYSSRVWGYLINCKVAWVVQESPCLWLPACLFLFADSPQLKEWPNRILVCLFLLHYFQRTCIFSVLIRGGKPSPLSTVSLAFIFCFFNSYIQVRSLMKYSIFPPNWLYSFQFITGCILFFIGMAINIHSDHILRTLRKPNETGYKIPQGGMFKYVTAANLFGEIVEWCGFAIACWSLHASAFALSTFCVLIPRSYTHHKFYLQKLDNYPKTRKIAIPFIW